MTAGGAPTLPDWSRGTGAIPPHGSVPPRFLGDEPAKAQVAVVIVHGRGDSALGIIGLANHLTAPGTLWVAPGAAHSSWYPHSFLAPVARNEPGRSSGLDVMARIVAGLEDIGLPRRRIVVGGFSQGACLSLEFAAREAVPLGGVFGLSGGLIGPPDDLPEYSGAMTGTPVFLGCSDVDPHIPVGRVHETAAVLQGLGAEVDARIYPGMGHSVNRDELTALEALLERVRGVAESRP